MAKKLNCLIKRDPRVSIVRTDKGIKEAVRESLDRIGGAAKFVKRGETVFVKPNLGMNHPPLTGAVTNPQVTKALIEIVAEQKPAKIMLGDSPSWGIDAEIVYDTTETRKIARETGCTLVNVDKDEKVECTITEGDRLKKTTIAKSILDCDKLINVPVIKTHVACVVSLGLKNMKGILPQRAKTTLHYLEPNNGYSGLETGVADLHRLIQPDLTVVDGTIGMEGFGPLDGDPVKLDLLISGEDAVLVDAVCATVMGFKPEEIPTIKLCAHNDGLELKSYQIEGLSIGEATRPLKPCPTEIYAGKNVKIDLGVACTGCLAALSSAIYRMNKKKKLDDINDLLICLGKSKKTEMTAEKVLYVGKCALEGELLKDHGKVYSVKGCPPVPMKIIQHFMEDVLERPFSIYEFHESSSEESK